MYRFNRKWQIKTTSLPSKRSQNFSLRLHWAACIAVYGATQYDCIEDWMGSKSVDNLKERIRKVNEILRNKVESSVSVCVCVCVCVFIRPGDPVYCLWDFSCPFYISCKYLVVCRSIRRNQSSTFGVFSSDSWFSLWKTSWHCYLDLEPTLGFELWD